MLKQKRYILAIIALYGVLLVYRFSFREDFEILELVQILLNTMADVFMTILSLVALNLAVKESVRLRVPVLRAGLLVIFGLAIYFIGVKTLIAIHRLVYGLTTGMADSFKTVFESLSYQIFDSYIVLAFGIIALSGFTFYTQWKEQQRLSALLMKERKESELNFLKAQINPHFIFNTLNNIHFLVNESNTQARSLIHSFSDLLRYQLYETGQSEVLLSDESEYLKKYISIQQIRKEEGFNVAFIEDIKDNVKIAPLLLIIPLENAFKYSPNSSDGSIEVHLLADSERIQYSVKNNINHQAYLSLAGGGLGVDNLKKTSFPDIR